MTHLKEIGRTEANNKILGFHMGDKDNNSAKKKIFMGELLYTADYER